MRPFRLGILPVFGLLILSMPSGAGGPDPAWPPASRLPGLEHYAESRQVVTIAICRRTSGQLDTVAVACAHGRAAAADSVRALVSAWVRTQPSPALTGRESLTSFCQVALDPLALDMPGHGEWRLPRFANSVLDQPGFRDWLGALRRLDGRFDRGGFLATAIETLRVSAAPAVLRDAGMRLKEAAGVLSTSPDSVYVLDPFQGMELDSAYRSEYDVDLGYSVYDRASGDRLFYFVSTMSNNDLGAWADGRHFILAGTIGLDAPGLTGWGWDIIRIPAIMIGDARDRILVYYLGPPLDECRGTKRWSSLEAMHRAYPKVIWDP
jgi:hypothetical protein